MVASLFVRPPRPHGFLGAQFNRSLCAGGACLCTHPVEATIHAFSILLGSDGISHCCAARAHSFGPPVVVSRTVPYFAVAAAFAYFLYPAIH
jgi:hypothetical protein